MSRVTKNIVVATFVSSILGVAMTGTEPLVRDHDGECLCARVDYRYDAFSETAAPTPRLTRPVVENGASTPR